MRTSRARTALVGGGLTLALTGGLVAAEVATTRIADVQVVAANQAEAAGACVIVAIKPFETLRSTVYGRTRTFCVGSIRTRTYSRLEYQVGYGQHRRWILAPHVRSSVGARVADYTSWERRTGTLWRTRGYAVVLDARGAIVKRYGWDQSEKYIEP